MSDRIDQLRADLDALTARVDHWERGEMAADPRPDRQAAVDGRFWALDELRARLPEHESTVDGAVMLVGSLTLPDGGPVEWQQGAGSAGMLEADWADQAAVFAALGHPLRLELLRHVLGGTHHTAELGTLASVGTAGQLHHHLRQLVSAGWLRQSGRGAYEVPAARVVPLLACLTAAQR